MPTRSLFGLGGQKSYSNFDGCNECTKSQMQYANMNIIIHICINSKIYGKVRN